MSGYDKIVNEKIRKLECVKCGSKNHLIPYKYIEIKRGFEINIISAEQNRVPVCER